MAAQQEQTGSGFNAVAWLGACLLICLLLAAAIGIVFSAMSKNPVYSVTVTGVAGLDNPSAVNLPLSPVFNLTVRIDNARGDLMSVACIGRLSTVSVSYGDAVLANRGSVPEFCVKQGKVRERGVRAWGHGVDLPQFLRDQLAGELAAGEAAVDVKVTKPAESPISGDTVFVCSQAKIGGGPATCRKETVYNQQQANPASIATI